MTNFRPCFTSSSGVKFCSRSAMTSALRKDQKSFHAFPTGKGSPGSPAFMTITARQSRSMLEHIERA